MAKHKINRFIIFFEIIIITISITLLYIVNTYNQNLYKFSNERLLMLQTADRLRQSSDDLSHFARTYVVTGELKFKKQYFHTLDIRNGEKPRPLLYNAIYWDLKKELREQKHPDGVKLSLKEIFKSLPYTKKELEKLKLSEENSNKLVDLEVEAFNAMLGLFKDKNGYFTIKDKMNQSLAIKLLHSKEYYQAKHLIMNPIDDFIIMLDKRTKEQVDDVQEYRDFYFTMFLASIILFIIGNIIVYRYLNEHEKRQKRYLKRQVEKAIETTKNQEKLLLKQEKFAALGEMMDAIAHQWKQPLTIISLAIDKLHLKYELNSSVTKEDIVEMRTNTRQQIEHLSSTIDDFRQFFRPNEQQEIVNLVQLLESTLALMKSELSKNRVNVNIKNESDIEYSCLANEFKHIYINLINNTKDAYIEKDIDDRKIEFSFIEDEKSIIIRCQDYAGGIPEDIIHRIFESNFTTKKSGKGTGIGLYLTKQIVEKHHGQIQVENKNNGACFTITIDK